ncbi:MAG: polysaccharide deacetylase family protein, partial [Clostridia bacterium]|nr:polysaccharide deacetylase family protein [Clostridia bacterium]
MAAICDSNDSSIDVPIIMYHSVKNDISDSAKYIVTPNQLESDLIYLAQNGYTTITMTDLIDYVYNDKKLPEKPIILTFDDGYFNNYYYAYPLMKKYNMKMVISVVGSYSDKFSEIDDSNPAYAYL